MTWEKGPPVQRESMYGHVSALSTAECVITVKGSFGPPLSGPRKSITLGVCRTYASRLDFCPFSLLLRCQNTHVAQLRSVFVALHQEKIIKNRLEALKSDRLLEEV